MRTSSRTVALLLLDEVELLDVAGMLQVLTMSGRQWNYRPFRIVAVSKSDGLVETRSQLRVEARAALEGCTTPEIVLVPGGYGARKHASDARVTGWLSAAARGATHVVAVGNGVLLLGAAGLLDGVDVSVSQETRPLLEELAKGARVDVDSRFREAGNLLTAATAAGGMEACLSLVARLVGRKQARAVATSIGLSYAEGAPAAPDIVEPS